MKKIIPFFLSVILVLTIAATPSSSQMIEPTPEAVWTPQVYFTWITFIRKVKYKYTPAGETKSVIVDALDINGFDLLAVEARTPTIVTTPEIKLGQEKLTVLYSGNINSLSPPLQQVIVRLPAPLLDGNYALVYNNMERWGWDLKMVGRDSFKDIYIPRDNKIKE